MDCKTVVIFGGTGFVGMHMVRAFLSEGVECVIAADLEPFPDHFLYEDLAQARDDGRLRHVECDVRHPIEVGDIGARDVDLIVNLAAVHRAVGPAVADYFKTNVDGAENVCDYAATVGCSTVVFTSSVAVYGADERARDEGSVPAPTTPYGSSKVAAEKVHEGWQKSGTGRRLVTVRPGVLFGPGSQANVTRLARAVNSGLFCYVGNRRTVKAGGYVKELCSSVLWAFDNMEDSHLLYNFTFDPPPTVEDYVGAIASALGEEGDFWSVPYPLVLAGSAVLSALSACVGRTSSIRPSRVRKIASSNNVRASYLTRHGYPFSYTLESAMAEWREESPGDWE